VKSVSALTVGAILLLGCSSEASSAQPGAMDRLSAYDTIDVCLYRETTPTGRQTCIGEYQAACERLSPNGDTTAGLLQCAAEEYEAWDRWLSDAYRDLREGLPEPSVAQLREAQRSWMAHRDLDCEFMAGLYAGGSLENVERATCQVRKTAERAIEFMRWETAYPTD
jgi:uncharacterized protein YecT (DUF1311 family)